MDEIRELHEVAIKAAKHNFDKFKRCAPVIFAKNEKEIFVIPLEFENDKEKEQVLSAAKIAMNKHKVTCYSTINEAWMLKLDKKDNYNYNSIRPSKHKDRVEVVIIVTSTKDKKIGTIFKIVRTGKDVALELDMDAQECMEGTFTELLDSMWE